MGESKKRLYKRTTASKALMNFSNRISEFTSGYTLPYPFELKDIIIFGSYARGEQRVHDLDIYIEANYTFQDITDYWDRVKIGDTDPIGMVTESINDFARFLKDKSPIFSFHSNLYADDEKEERKIALSGEHYYLMKDGEINYDVLDILWAMDK